MPARPVAESVGLGNVNGVTLGLHPRHRPGATPTATKDGSKYKISGTATGVDMANPMAAREQTFRNRRDLPLAASVSS